MSESEEMYLVNIARLIEPNIIALAPLSQLADTLGVQPASTHQMVRKLEEIGWVVYEPYKGVGLTTDGRRMASKILRHRRLWEVFLVEHLKISVTEAGTLACRLEHLIPKEAGERLADFLGNPLICPDGKLIPPAEGDYAPENGVVLTRLEINHQGKVSGIQADSATRAFLASEGLVPGIELTVLGIGSNGACLVGVGGGKSIHLSFIVAQTIWVKA